MKNIFLLFTFLVLSSCQINSQEKFDKEKWLLKENNKYTYREKMLEDLVTNVQLKGLTKKELIDLLGRSENMWETDKQLSYPILQNYDEPPHIINLVIVIDEKDIVDYFEIIDNRKIKNSAQQRF
ncbi:hypothetical protein [Flavobacterium sp. H122]|uniref:hypothetical protein n=1 Tax=Flavobacterium sp. H122 TaxID=2529860 RepID=UPI0010A99874|nr:hypothetical protein [Flavobacterium sp. H122]